MSEELTARVAAEKSFKVEQVEAVAALLHDGATVPFIARYRKEATGSLDEIAITAIRDRLAQIEQLEQRRTAILKSMEERGLLTEERRAQLQAAGTLSVLEDLYLPFRPKRRTRATVAREKGLEPLAQRLFPQNELLAETDVQEAALGCVDPEKGVTSAEEALAGARDIMAEWVNENTEARAGLRALFEQKASVRSRLCPGKETEGQKYRDYFEWEEPVRTAPSHRLLAMFRGEKEEALYLRIQPPEAEALALLEARFVKGASASSEQVRQAVHDSYGRLLSLSMETEIRLASRARADEEAIRVFTDNLRQLLLAPPLGQKIVLAVDPGFRTGCKLVCLDPQGKLLHHDVIYPHSGARERERAAEKTREICERFGVEAAAVGNGTAGRETLSFLEGMEFARQPVIVMVNESGASIYSASDAAREEFPDHDLTVRGSVSIGRRLQDPLAELVKIDPKSIGVGQYQHDVNQSALRQSLDDVVVHCVNAVGVEANTASKQILTYVSGLGPQLARNIVEHRNARGPFRTREDLMAVPRLGPKAFEQCAGFLRIRNGDNPLDDSAVHPESYPVVEAMARDLGRGVGELLRDPGLQARIRPEAYVSDRVGLPTLRDILQELAKPGLDPRETFEVFHFADHVHELKDLTPGMRLPGKVTNITRFGAFVDVGVHQDGLVHVSELADRVVKDPAEVVKLGQAVTVTVLGVDLERQRIALSLKGTPGGEGNGKRAGSGQEAPERQSAGKRKDSAAPERKARAPREPHRNGKKPSSDRPPADKLDPANPFVQAFKKAKWIR